MLPPTLHVSHFGTHAIISKNTYTNKLVGRQECMSMTMGQLHGLHKKEALPSLKDSGNTISQMPQPVLVPTKTLPSSTTMGRPAGPWQTASSHWPLCVRQAHAQKVNFVLGFLPSIMSNSRLVSILSDLTSNRLHVLRF